MMSKTMFLTKSVVKHNMQDEDTFQLIPNCSECPYIYAVYLPTRSVLVVMSKNKKIITTSTLFKKTTEEIYYEYHITDSKEILSFVYDNTENENWQQIKSYLKKDDESDSNS